MAVEGEVVEVKRGTCMPRAEVTVSALSSDWPFPMCLSCVLPDRCTRDQGLCCYACWCALCAHAEVAEQNGIRGPLFQKQWCLQCSVLLCANLLPWVFCSPCCSCVWAPCIMTAYGTQVRRAVKRKHGLPDDECCGPTCSTYLPAYLSLRCVPILFPNQTQCAAYQMLYFMRYTQKGPAPECRCLRGTQKFTARSGNDFVKNYRVPPTHRLIFTQVIATSTSASTARRRPPARRKTSTSGLPGRSERRCARPTTTRWKT